MRRRSLDFSSSPLSSTLEMSVRASLPKRFLLNTAAPVFSCRTPPRRLANASCSASANGWSRNTSTPCASRPARIASIVARSVTLRRSIALASAANPGCSSRNDRDGVTRKFYCKAVRRPRAGGLRGSGKRDFARRAPALGGQLPHSTARSAVGIAALLERVARPGYRVLRFGFARADQFLVRGADVAVLHHSLH